MGVVRRSTAAADDDDGDEATTPTSKASKPVEPDLDDDGLDEEDENETTGRASAVLGGKAGAQAIRQRGSDYANEFKFEKGTKHLVKFLEEESFASYRQHWVEKKGKKSYICIGKGCPLCGAGDRASGKYAFNIWSFDAKAVKALIAGPVLLDVIEEAVEATKSQKLTSGYWVISRSGKGQTTSYAMSQVKERDLDEDFGLDPAEAKDEYAEAVAYKASIFPIPTRAELVKVSREFNADDVSPDEDDD